jgi:hypothetical protein
MASYSFSCSLSRLCPLRPSLRQPSAEPRPCLLGQAFGLHLLVADSFPEGAAHRVAAHVQNR